MTDVSKKMVVGSMIASGAVVIAVGVDMAVGFPFNKSYVMDILFLLGAGLVGYMSYDAYQDLR